jgi:hypothetical protein
MKTTHILLSLLVFGLVTTSLLADGTEKKPADPEATRLLSEARANRALWKAFPGFTADVEVNLDGKLRHGTVSISAQGKIKLENLDQPAEKWVRQVLALDVAHRLNADSEVTPCAFADDDRDNPLGRAIVLLGDGMGSMYRVRDKQIMVVNRTMDRLRFAITVLETSHNKEGKYLPSSFVVHYWDGEHGDLKKTESYTQTWRRVGNFDLPLTTRTISTSREISAKSMTLSNHRLLAE